MGDIVGVTVGRDRGSACPGDGALEGEAEGKPAGPGPFPGAF